MLHESTCVLSPCFSGGRKKEYLEPCRLHCARDLLPRSTSSQRFAPRNGKPGPVALTNWKLHSSHWAGFATDRGHG